MSEKNKLPDAAVVSKATIDHEFAWLNVRVQPPEPVKKPPPQPEMPTLTDEGVWKKGDGTDMI